MLEHKYSVFKSLLSHNICVTYYISIKPECEKKQYMQLAHHLKEFWNCSTPALLQQEQLVMWLIVKL